MLDNRGKRQVGNSSAWKSSQKPVTKASSVKGRLRSKAARVQERLGPHMAPTKRRLRLGGEVIIERANTGRTTRQTNTLKTKGKEPMMYWKKRKAPKPKLQMEKGQTSTKEKVE